ncbi:MAG: tetraacyldisaccharide 4'-kinase, partial [Vitreimonas sp.]
HMLSRGYGGRIEGPLRVTPDMDAREVGDEPLLHARDGDAWIARDRLAGARAAAQAGAHAIVMDDGFQNPALAKDLCLVAVDPAYGIGNGQVFPAGPLRERLAEGLERADAIVMLHAWTGHSWTAGVSPADVGAAATELPARTPTVQDGPARDGAVQEWLADFAKPILHARLEPAGILPEGKLVAFAGLARPEKFFDTLSAMGASLEEGVPFGDHHVYTEEDLDLLSRMAEERGAHLITTEKDVARLSPEWRARVAVLPVAARFADEDALDGLLAPIRSRMNATHG